MRLNELERKGRLRGLILDLRENTGGFLSQAVKVAGLFIFNGVIVISKYANGEERFIEMWMAMALLMMAL